MEIYNLVSFAGIFVILFIAWLFSAERKRMNWHATGWGLGIQFITAVVIFTLPSGSRFFLVLNDLVVNMLEAASKGAEFVFGPLALAPGNKKSLGFILAFQSFPTIIFFSALISILYYLKIMPFIIKKFAYVFTKLMRVSGAESLCASSNIFVGIESAFTIRPHLKDMTRSELCTVLTAGMSTVASSVMALYVYTLRGYFPSIAGHLISASLLSAPAAIILSKILMPERQHPRTLGLSVEPHYERENNIFEAVINGASNGVKVIAGIVSLLIAVIGLVALLDMIIGGIGVKFNGLFGINIDWSLKTILGYIFYPLTVVIGVPLSDAPEISQIIGERLIVTEVTSYQHLSQLLSSGALMHPRSSFIAAYALCGFAHFASLAIFVGGISALEPSKTRVLSKVGLRALAAATLACLLTACIAGTFYNQNSILLGMN